MFERLKHLSGLALGAAILLCMLALPVLFIMGSLWAAEHLFQPLVVAGWIALAVDMVLLVVSIIPAARSFCGIAIFLSSYIFGAVGWLLGFILTYALWGLWAVILGMLMFGGGVVPFALLATLFKGMWEPFFSVIALVVLTFGARLLGLFIAQAGEAQYQA